MSSNVPSMGTREQMTRSEGALRGRRASNRMPGAGTEQTQAHRGDTRGDRDVPEVTPALAPNPGKEDRF